MLSKVQVDSFDDHVEKLLKAKSIYESDEISPKDALDMYAEKEPTMNRNEAVLSDLPGELYAI